MGYWIGSRDGRVLSFGDAAASGAVSPQPDYVALLTYGPGKCPAYAMVTAHGGMGWPPGAACPRPM
jgi:hypothetical protein